jgi:hypothetical protein
MLNTSCIIGFFAWYLLSLAISETLGSRRKIGTEWSFFACIFTTPVLGTLITLMFPKSIHSSRGSA